MKCAKLFFVTSLVVTLIGCSLKLQVVLFNNAGQVVIVHINGNNLAIASTKSGQFNYSGEEQNWKLHLSTIDCDYTYQVPKTLEHYPWPADSTGQLKVQIEEDFTIYLIPPTAVVIFPINQIGALQQDGFPLRPELKSCH